MIACKQLIHPDLTNHKIDGHGICNPGDPESLRENTVKLEAKRHGLGLTTLERETERLSQIN